MYNHDNKENTLIVYWQVIFSILYIITIFILYNLWSFINIFLDNTYPIPYRVYNNQNTINGGFLWPG
jgi:hypothetical protein